MRKALSLVILFFLVGIPLTTLILPTTTHAIGVPYWGPIVSCTADTGLTSTANLPKCESICDLFVTGQHALYLLLTIALFVALPILVAIAGIKMMISGGNTEGQSEGRSMLTGAATALLIIMGAYLIVNTLFYFAGKLTTAGKLNTNWSSIQCAAPAPQTP
jgi:hypothetical protein